MLSKSLAAVLKKTCSNEVSEKFVSSVCYIFLHT